MGWPQIQLIVAGLAANPRWIERQIGELGRGHLLQGGVGEGVAAPSLPMVSRDGGTAELTAEMVNQAFK